MQGIAGPAGATVEQRGTTAATTAATVGAAVRAAVGAATVRATPHVVLATLTERTVAGLVRVDLVSTPPGQSAGVRRRVAVAFLGYGGTLPSHRRERNA